uniref:Right handed beta helix domain-containing protein n=1 Tax=Amphimedon queenslandica TaxID=400682 RepID=A0A1X7U4C6_AMPQE
MSLLLVVVLLFFSSSCSVSSGQYYVSDDCSSVTQSPCNPLSVYARDMSQYNNTIFYFIGTTNIRYYVVAMTAVMNVTLHGLDQSPSIHCNKGANSFSMYYYNCDHVIISNLSFGDCAVWVASSINITITHSSFTNYMTYRDDQSFLSTLNAFDVKMSSVTFTGFYSLDIKYDPLPGCSSELLHYSLILTDVNFSVGGQMTLDIAGNGLGFPITFNENSDSSDCSYPGTQLTSTLLIEDSHFYNNKQGLKINSANINEGLFIDGTFLKSTQIDIIDTKLIGNGGNKIMNSNAISLSNVTVANSTYTGLSLIASIVAIKNNLIFKNNTGVVGGGLAINGSSRLIVSSSANLEFIDNHASYKGGGIYAEESTHSDIRLMAPNIPLTLINNSALVGGDMYGYYVYDHPDINLFKVTHSAKFDSTSDPEDICFCDPHTTTCNKKNCIAAYAQIFPGQALKFNVALFGYDYLKSQAPTDGTVDIFNHINGFLLNQTHIPSTCSLIEYTPQLTQLGYHTYYITSSMTQDLHVFFTVKECPIGFRLDNSQGSCTCSQSISRENVTCDINSLNITHNGLLWIGTYHTSTPFNANETNPNACIINEDCLLYCSPNPLTFKLNDTDTQCVDNRGHRMCGSCREGYSLLMGSNKCGQCHNNYTMIAWIALFAVMGLLLVVLLIALNLTVSVGTLNGLLFYANIVKLYEPVFSSKGALPVLSQVISWINLDFGFEICFYNGMDSYAKQWLQFAFPLYLWIIIIIIIQLCRRYGKISRLMGSHAVPVLSTLTFLSYTKLPIIDAYSGPMKDEYRFWPGLLLVARIPLSHMKCYDALIKKLFKKQDEDDEPLLDVAESHLTVDQQRRAMVPSSTDVRRCASRESVVELF